MNFKNNLEMNLHCVKHPANKVYQKETMHIDGLVCSAGDQIQGLTQTRQVLNHPTWPEEDSVEFQNLKWAC